MERNDEMLANTLDAAGVRAEYDSNVKNILSNKRVLAWILKSTAREFMDFSIDEIIGRIESDPQVQRISLLPHAVIPGETANGSELITGMAQESNIPNEGQITYDVRFSAFGINDEKAQVMLFVDLEAQKDPTPGYDIVTRGIFYCARMLSEQYGTTFTAPDYDKLEKVYSIWIVKNCSEKEANTISLYRMGCANLYGNLPDNARSDLLNAVLVRLPKDEGKSKERPSDIHRLLSTLLSATMSSKDKKEILQQEFDFQISDHFGREIDTMCNLSAEVYEKGMETGLAKGMETGLAKGMEKGIALSVRKASRKISDVSELAEMFELSESEINAILAQPPQQPFSVS